MGQSHAMRSDIPPVASAPSPPHLNPTDLSLLDTVQRQTLRYFWDFAHPACGLARERSNAPFDYGPEVVATGGSGFGVLGAVAHSPEQLEVDLTWIEEQVHGRPYGLDLLLPQKYAGADEGGIDRESVRQLLPPTQQEFVDDILRRYGVP